MKRARDSLSPSPSPSLEDVLREGDAVAFFTGHRDFSQAVLKSGECTHTQAGVFSHDRVVNRLTSGSVVFAEHVNEGKRRRGKWDQTYRISFSTVFKLTPELNAECAVRKTQIVYSLDASIIVSQLDLCPGKIVLESGTGSGALTQSFARAVGSAGAVHTYEFNEDRFEHVQDSLCSYSNVTCRHGDVTIEFADAPAADAVFLDVPAPWLCLDSASAKLKPQGRICSFSPCMEQVQRFAYAAKAKGYVDVETYEALSLRLELKNVHSIVPTALSAVVGEGDAPDEIDNKAFDVRYDTVLRQERQTRRYRAQRSHTSYLTFATKN